MADPRKRLGKRKSSLLSPRCLIHIASVSRVCSVISNWTGRSVFCCITIVRAATRSPCITSRTRSFTRSQERNLLSTARSNRANSRLRPPSCKRIRIAQISFSFNGDFWPTSCLCSKAVARSQYSSIVPWHYPRCLINRETVCISVGSKSDPVQTFMRVRCYATRFKSQ